MWLVHKHYGKTRALNMDHARSMTAETDDVLVVRFADTHTDVLRVDGDVDDVAAEIVQALDAGVAVFALDNADTEPKGDADVV